MKCEVTDDCSEVHELPKLKGQPEGVYAPRLNFTVRRFVAAT